MYYYEITLQTTVSKIKKFLSISIIKGISPLWNLHGIQPGWEHTMSGYDCSQLAYGFIISQDELLLFATYSMYMYTCIFIYTGDHPDAPSTPSTYKSQGIRN